MEMCLLATLAAPLPMCECSVSDFLHLGFPAPFAGEPPAVVDAAAPHGVHVALQVPPTEVQWHPQGHSESPGLPYSGVHLSRAEAQQLKGVYFLPGGQKLQKNPLFLVAQR